MSFLSHVVCKFPESIYRLFNIEESYGDGVGWSKSKLLADQQIAASNENQAANGV